LVVAFLIYQRFDEIVSQSFLGLSPNIISLLNLSLKILTLNWGENDMIYGYYNINMYFTTNVYFCLSLCKFAVN
jgi:hypothetical protein